MKKITGKISYFGGKDDRTMTITETLALYPFVKGRWLHYPLFFQNYCAMRWNYREMSRQMVIPVQEVCERLRWVEITVEYKGKKVDCFPVDWGPNVKTNRIIDVSKNIINLLGCKTDDIVIVTYPNWIELDD
jgi:hypothetical protein